MTRVSQTRPGHRSGCPWVWVRVTVRAPVTRAQPISKATANAGQRRPTQVNAGPQQPTKANAGPQRQKRDRYVFFCNVHFIAFYQLFIFYFLITTKPTKAHSSQQRPTQVNACPQQPTEANAGPRSIGMSFFVMLVFFIFYFLITTKPTKAHSSQQQPTQVNTGPQHPTKANAGPQRRKRDRYVFF